jgi:hypothetical protein
VILELGKTFISRQIFHQHWYTCPIALIVLRNSEHKFLWLLSQPFPLLRFNLFAINKTSAIQLWIALRYKHFPPQTENIYLWISFALRPFAHRKRTTGLCSSVLYFSSTVVIFDYLNQPLNMRMRVCYVDCHEAGLCCYLVTHIKTYYVRYSCFTSIFELFTDSPSYFKAQLLVNNWGQTAYQIQNILLIRK